MSGNETLTVFHSLCTQDIFVLRYTVLPISTPTWFITWINSVFRGTLFFHLSNYTALMCSFPHACLLLPSLMRWHNSFLAPGVLPLDRRLFPLPCSLLKGVSVTGSIGTHTPAVQPFCQRKPVWVSDFWDTASNSPAAHVISQLKKNEAQFVSTWMQCLSTFFLFILFYQFVRPGRCCNKCKGKLGLVAATACSHLQEMEGKTAVVGEGRGREWWMEGCQRIREKTKEWHSNPHDALLSLSFPLSLSARHDSSINGGTLVPAGQSGLALLSEWEMDLFSPPTYPADRQMAGWGTNTGKKC